MKKVFMMFVVVVLVSVFFGTSLSYAESGVQLSGSGCKSESFRLWSVSSPENVLKYYMSKNNSNNKSADYSVKTKKVEANGDVVFKIQQTYDGIPVFGYSRNVIIDGAGTVKFVSGWDIPLFSKTNKGIKGMINSTVAKNTAIKDAGCSIEGEDFHCSCDKVILADDNIGYYCYLVKLSYLNPKPGNWYYFIDSFTGKVVLKYNHLGKVLGTSANNTGIGVHGDKKTINVTKSTFKDQYYLQDNTRGKGIYTYTANSTTKTPGTLCSDTNGIWDSDLQKAAVDAQYFAEVTYDYYKNVLKRNSYDNKGSAIKSTVHYDKNFCNAFWNGYQMVYGDGDGKTFLTMSGGLDVVAHELTHAVTEDEVGLVYQKESGAISESLSDIFGTLAEYYCGVKPDWLMGEDICLNIRGNALRSLAAPCKFGDPDHYSKRYTGSEDNGGVHTNSGIINKAAYLISEGGTHYGVAVSGIGRDKLGAILYKSICSYLTANATFSQFRACAVQSATDLYGEKSKEVVTVGKAFDAVGVK